MMHNVLVQNQKQGDRKPLFSLPSITGNLNFWVQGLHPATAAREALF
jgi:hypothetical protein